MQYDKLIFVQAVGDLRYALSIYEKHKGEKIQFCVINVRNVYEFIKTLDLDVNTTVDFFPYIEFNRKNPFSYLKAKKEYARIYNDSFSHVICKDIYFFSRFYDWFTTGVIVRLIKRKNNIKVIYYDHYDDASIKNDTILRRGSFKYIKYNIIAKIISYVSSVDFLANYEVRNLEFNYNNYDITKTNITTNLKVSNQFLYKIKEKENILFLLSPSEVEMLTESSLFVLKDLLIELGKRTEKRLVLKAHPRLGKPTGFDPYFDEILPLNIPLEFVDFTNVKKIIGVVSSALNYGCNFNIDTVSLIEFLDFVDIEKKIFYKEFLRELSNNRIRFLSNKVDIL